MSKKTAIVLVSGGLDSATCLAMAKAQGYECYAISFEYGQRSNCELQAAKEITKAADVVEHKIFSLQIGELGGSALTDEHIQFRKKSVQEYQSLMCQRAIRYFYPMRLLGPRY